jgi:hypothetical protein
VGAARVVDVAGVVAGRERAEERGVLGVAERALSAIAAVRPSGACSGAVTSLPSNVR